MHQARQASEGQDMANRGEYSQSMLLVQVPAWATCTFGSPVKSLYTFYVFWAVSHPEFVFRHTREAVNHWDEMLLECPSAPIAFDMYRMFHRWLFVFLFLIPNRFHMFGTHVFLLIHFCLSISDHHAINICSNELPG